MAIQEFAGVPMSDEEIDRVVNKIIQSLGNSFKDFQHASQEYNIDWFEDEPDELRLRLCTALKNHFRHVGTNTFWNHNAGND